MTYIHWCRDFKICWDLNTTYLYMVKGPRNLHCLGAFTCVNLALQTCNECVFVIVMNILLITNLLISWSNLYLESFEYTWDALYVCKLLFSPLWITFTFQLSSTYLFQILYVYTYYHVFQFDKFCMFFLRRIYTVN